jgi:hypothetical protein
MYLKELSHKQKEELNEDVKNFLEDYFNGKGKNYPFYYIAKADLEEQKEQGNQFIFTVSFSVTWNSENIDYYIKIIEESKKKFENLRKMKSDKLDKNPHLEFLLIEVPSFTIKTPEDHAKELYEKFKQRGYDYPFYLFKNPDNPNFEFYLICMNGETKPIDKEIK